MSSVLALKCSECEETKDCTLISTSSIKKGDREIHFTLPGDSMIKSVAIPEDGDLGFFAEWLQQVDRFDLRGCKSIVQLPHALVGAGLLRVLLLRGCRALTSLPSQIGSLVNLERLCLRDCESLAELPQSIGALTSLVSLDTGRCLSLQSLPEEVGDLYNMQYWNLQSCSLLEEIPETVRGLTRLRKLIMRDCTSLAILPPGIIGFRMLQELTLSRCSVLEEFPDSFSGMNNLQHLDLIFCHEISELPPSFSKLSQLKSLLLAGCSKLQLLPENIGEMNSLQRLSVHSCTKLKLLPDTLCKLALLTELDLSECKRLRTLPEAFRELTSLQTLRLSGCTFSTLPQSISALTLLKILQVGGCSDLVSLPDDFGKLPRLQELDLSGCSELRHIPETLGSAASLVSLKIGCQMLEELPASITRLTSLTELTLPQCRSLKLLPQGLSVLRQLRDLDLQDCSSLREVPAEVHKLPLDTINLIGCSALHTPPQHLIRDSVAAILRFLKDVARESTECHLVKMVLVGDSRQGKSSLLDSLMSGGTPCLRKENDRTVGMDVRRWQPDAAADLVAMIYDAAGHKVYQATHGLFMTSEDLFVNVVSAAGPEEDAERSLLAWIAMVQMHAPGAPMVIIWTHKDELVSENADLQLEATAPAARTAKMKQAHVMERVRAELESQIQRIDRAVRQEEASLNAALSSHSKTLSERWQLLREQRDDHLQRTDRDLLDTCVAEGVSALVAPCADVDSDSDTSKLSDDDDFRLLAAEAAASAERDSYEGFSIGQPVVVAGEQDSEVLNGMIVGDDDAPLAFDVQVKLPTGKTELRKAESHNLSLMLSGSERLQAHHTGRPRDHPEVQNPAVQLIRNAFEHNLVKSQLRDSEGSESDGDDFDFPDSPPEDWDPDGWEASGMSMWMKRLFQPETLLAAAEKADKAFPEDKSESFLEGHVSERMSVPMQRIFQPHSEGVVDPPGTSVLASSHACAEQEDSRAGAAPGGCLKRKLEKGAKVQFRGLKVLDGELNGFTATVEAELENGLLYVREDGLGMALPVTADTLLAVGDQVVVAGLRNRRDLNGTVVVVEGLSSKGMAQVAPLGGGPSFRIASDKLEFASDKPEVQPGSSCRVLPETRDSDARDGHSAAAQSRQQQKSPASVSVSESMDPGTAGVPVGALEAARVEQEQWTERQQPGLEPGADSECTADSVDMYLDVVCSSATDSQRTSHLTYLLASCTPSPDILQCFEPDPLFDTATRSFSGIPDWDALARRLSALFDLQATSDVAARTSSRTAAWDQSCDPAPPHCLELISAICMEARVGLATSDPEQFREQIRQTLDAMNRYPLDHDVQYHGCHALASIFSLYVNEIAEVRAHTSWIIESGTSKVVGVFLEERCISTFIAALKNWSDRPALVSSATRLLYSFCMHNRKAKAKVKKHLGILDRVYELQALRARLAKASGCSEEDVSSLESACRRTNCLLTILVNSRVLQPREQDAEDQAASARTRTQQSFSEVRRLHREMRLLEQRADATPESVERLEQLRLQREKKPRLLLCKSVSNRTGQGLQSLLKQLLHIMQEPAIFPQLGMKVPSSYAMLERVSAVGADEADSEPAVALASWEHKVVEFTKHNCREKLRRACKAPYLLLASLKQAAWDSGMDGEEVESALKFLHNTGSLLHYTHAGFDAGLQDYVFLKPQWIIDSVKYIIHDPRSTEVDDELREMGALIRADAGAFEDLRLLHEKARLSRRLLSQYLWALPKHQPSGEPKFPSKVHPVLIKLLKSFRLLRPELRGGDGVGIDDDEWYLVPAMISESRVPDEFCLPVWNRPTRAENALATICCVFRVIGGGLPPGMMSEVQAALATEGEAGCQDHFRPSSAVLDSRSGSVLSLEYGEERAKVKEWVVLSSGSSAQNAGGTCNEVRLLAWVEQPASAEQGATAWPLFRRVHAQVELAKCRVPGLCLRTFIPLASGDGQQACQEALVPDGAWTEPEKGWQGWALGPEETGMVESGVTSSWTGGRCGLGDFLPRRRLIGRIKTKIMVEAFFARTRTDKDNPNEQLLALDQESQELIRAVHRQKLADCLVNSMPTLADLARSLERAADRSVRILHLAGHGTTDSGFHWHGTDGFAEEHAVVSDVVEMIGRAACSGAKQGTVECVVLNACATLAMGVKLQQAGVSTVICWKTAVADSLARSFSICFYESLFEDMQGKLDYRQAFRSALKRLHSSNTVAGWKDGPSNTDTPDDTVHVGGQTDVPRSRKGIAMSAGVAVQTYVLCLLCEAGSEMHELVKA